MAIPFYGRSSRTPVWYGHDLTHSGLLRWISRHYTAQKVVFPEHFLPHAEIAMVIKGAFSLAMGNQQVDLTPGTLTVVPADSLLGCGTGGCRGLVYWAGVCLRTVALPATDLTVETDRMRILFERVGRMCIPFGRAATVAVENYFRLCDQRCENRFLLEGAALSLVGEVADAIESHLTGHGNLNVNTTAAVQRLRPALAIIDAIPEKTPHVKDLAEACSMGRTAFAVAFRSTIGYTPSDYLAMKKIQRACEMFRAGASSVTDVTIELGFSTLQYFSATFRRYTGMSPSEFRQGLRAH